MKKLILLLMIIGVAGKSESQQVIDVKVTVDKTTYSGPCPVVITFKATIYSKGQGSFKYVWLRSDNAIDNNNSFVTLSGTGVDVVTTTWTIGAPGMTFSGWEALKIISPVTFTSNHADFSIKCNPGQKNTHPVAHSNMPPGCDSIPAGYRHDAMANLLSNESFETVGPSGSPVMSSVRLAANSAAANWTTWIRSDLAGTIRSELIQSSCPAGGDKMIHVTTTGGGAGIVQTFGTNDGGPARVILSAWIYVVAGGPERIGVGNGGNTSATGFTTTKGKWEYIQTCNSVSPANEMIIYGANSDFYIDRARVTIIR
jgi:hypothetical protein